MEKNLNLLQALLLLYNGLKDSGVMGTGQEQKLKEAINKLVENIATEIKSNG